MKKRKEETKVNGITLDELITHAAENFAMIYAYQKIAEGQRTPFVIMALDKTGHAIWDTLKDVISNDFNVTPDEMLRLKFQTKYETCCLNAYEGINDGSIDVQAIEKNARDNGINLGPRILDA